MQAFCALTCEPRNCKREAANAVSRLVAHGEGLLSFECRCMNREFLFTCVLHNDSKTSCARPLLLLVGLACCSSTMKFSHACRYPSPYPSTHKRCSQSAVRSHKARGAPSSNRKRCDLRPSVRTNWDVHWRVIYTTANNILKRRGCVCCTAPGSRVPPSRSARHPQPCKAGLSRPYCTGHTRSSSLSQAAASRHSRI